MTKRIKQFINDDDDERVPSRGDFRSQAFCKFV